jgi:hypothetical protein
MSQITHSALLHRGCPGGLCSPELDLSLQHLPAQELTFPEFVAKYSEEEVPYHRIVYFKHDSVRIWWVCSPSYSTCRLPRVLFSRVMKQLMMLPCTAGSQSSTVGEEVQVQVILVDGRVQPHHPCQSELPGAVVEYGAAARSGPQHHHTCTAPHLFWAAHGALQQQQQHQVEWGPVVGP